MTAASLIGHRFLEALEGGFQDKELLFAARAVLALAPLTAVGPDGAPPRSPCTHTHTHTHTYTHTHTHIQRVPAIRRPWFFRTLGKGEIF